MLSQINPLMGPLLITELLVLDPEAKDADRLGVKVLRGTDLGEKCITVQCGTSQEVWLHEPDILYKNMPEFERVHEGCDRSTLPCVSKPRETRILRHFSNLWNACEHILHHCTSDDWFLVLKP